MPEITGTVTAKSEKGIMIDQLGERWANWSNIEYRGTPFDTTVQKGDVVCITYTEKEWPDGKKSLFISVIDKVTQAQDVTPTYMPDDFPLPDGPYETRAAPAYGAMSSKDALILQENAITATSMMYAACLNAQIIAKMPTPAEFGAYRKAIQATLD